MMTETEKLLSICLVLALLAVLFVTLYVYFGG